MLPIHSRSGLHARGDRAEIAVAELELEIQQFVQAALFRHLARAHGEEVDRGELAGDDGNGLDRSTAGRKSLEQSRRKRLLRVVTELIERKLHIVLSQLRYAKSVVDEQLALALGHSHRRQDRTGRIRSDDKVDPGGESVVEGAGQVGLRLVVEQHPFDRAAEQPVSLVDLLEEDLSGELVNEPGRGEGTGQGERGADSNRRAGRRGVRRYRRAERESTDRECSRETAGRGKKNL
jgi:hypothetical protein